MIAKVLLKSMTQEAIKYDKQSHLVTFLALDIPKLFELPVSDGTQTCMKMFEDGWKKHIEDNKLQEASQECLRTFLLVSILSMLYWFGMSTC